MEEIPIIYKKFSSAFCGNRFYESVKLENKSKEITTFAIVPKQCKRLNSGFERLTIYPEKVDVSPGKSGRFKLTYLSYLENINDNVTYDIMESDKLIGKLQVQAQSVGPLLSFRTNNIKFVWFRDIQETTKRIELINRINYDSKFCFDSDEDGQTFQIYPLCGVVLAGSKMNIKLTFDPKEAGIYHKQIFCLLQFHEPLILNVIGIYNPKIKLEKKNLTFEKEFSQNFFKSSYEAYMHKLNRHAVNKTEKISHTQKCAEEYEKCLKDLITAKNISDKKFRFLFNDPEESEIESDITPTVKDNKRESKVSSDHIFLTNYFIDIKNVKRTPNATTLVNSSSSKKYAYHWEHDCNNHFQVEPCKGIISPNEKISFCLFFTPSMPDQLYYKEIDLRIFSQQSEEGEKISQVLHLPLTLSFKIVGHAFPTDYCGWIPQCTVIPKNLQLPSCVPGEVVYGTFMIERRGYLPVTFVICLPKDSNYTVQPPVGCIANDFQTFVIQFNGKPKEGVYVEDLKIIYNNSPENFDIIRIKTSVEIPELIFGNENSFNFNCCFPGSKTTAMVPVKNCTNLNLRFEVEIPEDVSWLDIPNRLNIIGPMTSNLIQVIFKPVRLCLHETHFICTVKSTSAVEYCETINVKLTGSCQFGYLIATPNMHDFGECVYTQKKKMVIHLFNFSPVALYYSLCVASKSLNIINNRKEVKVKPDKGLMPGKGSTALTVTINPQKKDVFEGVILCYIMENNSEDATPCDDEPTVIFTLKFEGVLPTFQIIDLSVDNGGPLFSPHWLWKMLSINSLNKFLDSLQSKAQLELYFPEAVIGSPKLNITLLLEANRFGETSWKIKKKMMCNCSTLDKNGEKHEECPHSKAMNIFPTEGTLKPNRTFIMHIVVSYHIQEASFQWTLSLPFNRIIYLNCTIVAIPNEVATPTSLFMQSQFNLEPIFVGNLHPPLQLFWLYNNTSYPSTYEVEKVTLQTIIPWTENIFDCLNPKGIIPPFSCVPLKILFKPNELITYSAEITLINKKNNEIPLRITGRGVRENQIFTNTFFEITVPEKPILRNETVNLECNVNFINIPYLKPFSQIKRIFFIRNTSKTFIWAFQWHVFCLKDLITAQVEPCEGKINPEEEAIMTLVLNSFGQFSFISFSLPCDIINYSLLKTYSKYKQFFNCTNEKLEEYFTITEKGTTFGAPNIAEPEKPISYHIFLTVNTSVVSPFQVKHNLLVGQEITLDESDLVEYRDKSLCKLEQPQLLLFQNILERILWNSLNSQFFKEQCNMMSTNFNYLDILPKHKKKSRVSEKSLVLPKTFIQNFLEDVLQYVLFTKCKNNNF